MRAPPSELLAVAARARRAADRYVEEHADAAHADAAPRSPVPGEVGEVDEVTLPGADRARAWARELAARGG